MFIATRRLGLRVLVEFGHVLWGTHQTKLADRVSVVVPGTTRLEPIVDTVELLAVSGTACSLEVSGLSLGQSCRGLTLLERLLRKIRLDELLNQLVLFGHRLSLGELS